MPIFVVRDFWDIVSNFYVNKQYQKVEIINYLDIYKLTIDDVIYNIPINQMNVKTLVKNPDISCVLLYEKINSVDDTDLIKQLIDYYNPQIFGYAMLGDYDIEEYDDKLWTDLITLFYPKCISICDDEDFDYRSIHIMFSLNGMLIYEQFKQITKAFKLLNSDFIFR